MNSAFRHHKCDGEDDRKTAASALHATGHRTGTLIASDDERATAASALRATGHRIG